MNYKRFGKKNDIVWVESTEQLISDSRSALDLIMTVRYETGLDKIILDKRCIAGDFFVLSTGLAGEILQKFVNYHVKAAIFGDFSGYTSKPLRDFIRESNRGKNIFFTATLEEAAQKLEGAEAGGVSPAGN